MSASTNRLDPDGQPANLQFDKIVDAASKHLISGLETLFDGMLDGADDTLFGLAEKADNNQLQQVYFETMRMLRLGRTNIKHAFNTEMEQSLQPGFQRQVNASDDPFDDDELSLVDQDSMEEMVAITGVHTKAMQMYKDELLHLGKRLEFVAEHTRKVFPKESVEPKNICEVFRDSVSPISDQIEIQNKLILFKLFDNKLICNLGDVYRGMNVLLINAGVMPKISVGQLVGRTRGRQRRPVRPSLHAPDEYMSADDCATRLQSFDESNYARYQTAHPDALDYQSVQVLSRFLQQTQGGAPLSPQTPDDHFSTGDVLNGLSMMQGVADFGERLSADQLKNALVQKISTSHGGGITRQVSQLDEKTIDLIQMLFDAMIEDDSVPQPIKSLLLRLQIPVIKSAMLDTEFFTNPHHPSRNLLNGLATSGLQITSEEDDIFPQLSSIVDGVVDNYEQDVVCFQQAFDELNTLLHDEEVKAREIEARTQKETLHAHARIIVLQELKNQIRGKNFPQGAHRLVLKHWSTVMYHRYVKYGKNSDQWFDSVDTLKAVMASLQNYRPEDSADDLAIQFNELTDKLDAELLKTRLDRVAVLDSLDDLREVHEFMLENHRRSQEIEQAVSLENLTDDLASEFGTGDIEEQLAFESSEIDSESGIENDPEMIEAQPSTHRQTDEINDSSPTQEESFASQLKDSGLEADTIELTSQPAESAQPENRDTSPSIDDSSDDIADPNEHVEEDTSDDVIVLETIELSDTEEQSTHGEIGDLSDPLDSFDTQEEVSDSIPDLEPAADDDDCVSALKHDEHIEVFPKETPEFDLSSENAKDIATAMALGLTGVTSELSEQSDEDQSLDTLGPVNGDDQLEPVTSKAPDDEEQLVAQEAEPDDSVEVSSVDDVQSNVESAEKDEPIPEKFTPIIIGSSDKQQNTANPSDEFDPSGESASEEADAHAAQNVLLNRLQPDIKPGVWINLYTGYREPEIRAKLSVIIPETETLVFVDRGGIKAAEKNVDDFATELDEGLIQYCCRALGL